MFFENVYKKVSKKNEVLKYEIINTNVELNDELVDSLMRSKAAKVKSTDTGYDLYYNF